MEFQHPDLHRIDLELSYCKNFNVREATIAQIQSAYASNQISAADLVDCYTKRIRAFNPYLHAVIEMNPDAISIAKELDTERLKSGIRSPLHGIPVLIKDNIGTKDQMETCAGALALVGLKPKRDSDVATNLRKAGAIILGKANLSEFANFRGEGIPNGWSGRGYQCHNAYALSGDPLGSSSGSAVSVAANLCTVAIGTETDGSLIAPASVACVVGFKPAVGNISGTGVIPLAVSQDSVGPIARTVTDAALLYSAIAKKPLETKCFDMSNPDIFSCLNMKFRVGVLRFLWSESPEQVGPMEKALDALAHTGVILQDPADTNEVPFLLVNTADENCTLNLEFKTGINNYLANCVIHGKGNKVKTLADIIQYNKDHPSPENYNQRVLEESEKTNGIRDPCYEAKRDANIAAARKAIDGILEKGGLDALVSPSDGEGKHFCAVAGYPVISVPVGFAGNGIPFGISFYGTGNSEEKLLMIAYRFEMAFKGRHTSIFRR